METTCLLVCEPGILLDIGIEEMLSPHKDIYVIRCLAKQVDGFYAAVKYHHPEVILFCELSPFITESVFTWLLMENPRLRIIVVNQDSNWMVVYQKEQVWINQSADLINLIRANLMKPAVSPGDTFV
jgi:hypothetical protein